MKRLTVLTIIVLMLTVGVGVASALTDLGMNQVDDGSVNSRVVAWDRQCDNIVDFDEIVDIVAVMDGRKSANPNDEFTVQFDLVPGATSHRVDLWVGAYANAGSFVSNSGAVRTYHHWVVGDPDCLECPYDADKVQVGAIGELSTWKVVNLILPDCCEDRWMNLDLVLWKVTVTPETYVMKFDGGTGSYYYEYTDAGPSVTVPVNWNASNRIWDLNQPGEGNYPQNNEWFAILFW